MKRILLSLLICLLVISLVGCGTYHPPITPGEDGGNNSDPPTPPSEIGDPFTVSLVYKGEPFIPKGDLEAGWSDGFSFHSAPFDETGVATITGLDGDYKVTLSGSLSETGPTGNVIEYTYNPNIYTATNTQKHVEIELFRLKKGTGGKGDGLYSCLRITGASTTETNVYRATLTRPGQKVYFEFVPPTGGAYVIESWVDTTLNQTNPIADVYTGTAAKYKDFVSDTGGKADIFTKNFKFDIKSADEERGNTYTFGIYAETKTDVYPITIDFSITYVGEHYLDHIVSNMVIPHDLYETLAKEIELLFPLTGEAFSQLPTAQYFSTTQIAATYAQLRTLEGWQKGDLHDTMTLHGFFSSETDEEMLSQFLTYYLSYKWSSDGLWTDPERFDRGTRIFDTDMYRYNESTGFYHVWDEATYSTSVYGAGYGPILYAKVSYACRFTDAFSTIEYAGNKALTVNEGKENYKLFIEGYSHVVETLLAMGYGGTEFGCPPVLYDMMGYHDFSNMDGAVPVTPELKDFLMKFSVNQRYFMDGEGRVETHPTIKVYASDEDQWLFACGYYAPIP